MAKYERFFPEYKKQLTEYEDRLAMLMQYTTWDLKEEEMRHKLKETAKSLKDMAISEWKSKQKASCEKKAEKQTDRWEYWCGVYDNTGTLEQKMKRKSLEQFMNEKGEDGWELMRIGDTEGNFVRLVFKRMRQ